MEGLLPSENTMQTEPSTTDSLHQLNVRPPAPSPTSNVLDAGSLVLNISAEEQSYMIKSIQAIFETEEEPSKEDEGEDEEPVVDLEDQQRRTERLKGVLSTLARLWWSDSEHMDSVAEKLADGSRDRELGSF
jgi:hypothetical protein